MDKIRILLSGNRKLQYYLDAVTAAGAEPTAQYLPTIDTGYDALILCGGNDIDPKYYQEAMDGAVDIDEARDTAEFALLKAYVEAGKPVLGICRGHQIINVFFGGSLYQHLPETPIHKGEKELYITHSVTAREDSMLGRLYGTAFAVNSYHHQAVKALGEGLRATAWWDDKYVEAVEHCSLPIFGVQWHPEQMCCSKARQDTADGLEIFKYFVELCKR